MESPQFIILVMEPDTSMWTRVVNPLAKVSSRASTIGEPASGVRVPRGHPTPYFSLYICYASLASIEGEKPDRQENLEMAIRRRPPLAAALAAALAVVSIVSADVYFEERFGGMRPYPGSTRDSWFVLLICARSQPAWLSPMRFPLFDLISLSLFLICDGFDPLATMLMFLFGSFSSCML